MRVYTCIFEKNGKVAAQDITGPFDRAAAIDTANDKLGLNKSADKLYALVPGQHSDRLWIVEAEKVESSGDTVKRHNIVSSGPWPENLPPGF
jgi:hypothetical protein